jgi:glucan phosphoethanolaminetransferase (alkaline phosphatase superfamily)
MIIGTAILHAVFCFWLICSDDMRKRREAYRETKVAAILSLISFALIILINYFLYVNVKEITGGLLRSSIQLQPSAYIYAVVNFMILIFSGKAEKKLMYDYNRFISWYYERKRK